ncbi:MAG TPA: hypothetical protein VIX37_07230, partial [Candidatus Sulfotelmatobacter sp.]
MAAKESLAGGKIRHGGYTPPPMEVVPTAEIEWLAAAGVYLAGSKELRMGRTGFWCLSVLLFFASALLRNLNVSGASNPPATIPQGLIQHVVIIFQENRTPDNLFHGLPNADIANKGVNSHGKTITLAPISLANRYDLGHRHPDFVLMYDNGKMDGANKVTACKPGTSGCPTNPQFQYVKPSDVDPYFQLARQYTFGD